MTTGKLKGDHLTFRRAARISLLGLALQVLVTVFLFVYARVSGGRGFESDHAAMTASIHAATGIIIWATMLLVYDQRRRERLEALEAEQLAAGGGSASAFDGVADDLRVAGRRLAVIQKWVVPAAAVLFATLNITFGFLRLGSWNRMDGPSYLVGSAGWGMALGLSIAVLWFVFARFVSGMGTIKIWSGLRAGAAQAVAIALIGLLIGAGAFFELAVSQAWLMRTVPMIVPIVMIVLGSETVLHLVLDLYRPRNPGEEPRPAFDSRLLGLIAAPDRIAGSVGEAVNYQFGVDITSSWFYAFLTKWIAVLIAMAVLTAWLMSMLVVVPPYQRGLILASGKISEPLISFGDVGEGDRRDIGPGLHVKMPWPFQSYEVPTIAAGRSDRLASVTSGVRVLHLASDPPDDPTKPILWGESHTAREKLNIVQPGGQSGEGDTSASALALLAIEVPVQYVVRDVQLFDQFAAPGQRERMLSSIGRRVVTQYLGERTADELLAGVRTMIPQELADRLTAAYGELNDGRGAGIEILYVGANGVHPPQKVAPNFERVVQARQNRESILETAMQSANTRLTEVAGSFELANEIADRIDDLRALGETTSEEAIELELEIQRLLERAGGESGELLLSAGATRWKQHMDERGRAALLLGQEEAYEAAPALYRSKLYFEALLEIMENSRVYLTPGDLEGLRIRMELQDRERGTDVFDEEAGAELAT